MADAKSGSRERGGEGRLRSLGAETRWPPKRSAANARRPLGPRTARGDNDVPLPRSFSGQRVAPRSAPIPHPS